MDAPKIADDPVNGEIRAAIIDHYISDGQPTPRENWLYSRLVEAHVKLREMDAALLQATELAEAIKPLIPERDLVSGELRDKWQRVANAIYRAAGMA